MNKVASKEQRTMKVKTMDSVLTYIPKDGFKLSDKVLNKKYRVTDVDEFNIGKNKSFSITCESDDGSSITLSASVLKRARWLTAKDVKIKPYKKHEHILMRSEADELWNGSVYGHKGLEMVKGKTFIIPEYITLRYAILAEDADNGKPILNPFQYKYFRQVVKEYEKRDKYPTQSEFKEELEKTPEDGRFAFLPASMKTPTPFAWIKEDNVSDYRFTLVLVPSKK